MLEHLGRTHAIFHINKRWHFVFILLTLHCCGSAYNCSAKQHFYFMGFLIYNFTQELFKILYYWWKVLACLNHMRKLNYKHKLSIFKLPSRLCLHHNVSLNYLCLHSWNTLKSSLTQKKASGCAVISLQCKTPLCSHSETSCNSYEQITAVISEQLV